MGNKMRRKDTTICDRLLDCAHSLVETEGIEALNIRSLAQRAGVATGTVYNYFSNKEDILLALTETYWRKTLSEMKDEIAAGSFSQQLLEIYGFLKERIDYSAGKLMGSLTGVEAAGQQRMAAMQQGLERELVCWMRADEDIRNDIWNTEFTMERYAHFVMMNLLILLKEETPDLHLFLTVVQHTIY